MEKSNINRYAYLPEDLLHKLLTDVPKTATKLAERVKIEHFHTRYGKLILKKNELIKKVSNQNTKTESLIAVDGANIVQKMTGSDLLMSIAVGVEGLTKESSSKWSEKGQQFYQWQDVLPHHVANSRLCQGIMFLMELTVLANADHKFRIMDGSHITSILKINSLLSARGESFADEDYVSSLNHFLKDNYDSIIPDVPDILDKAFGDQAIIGMAKYSSSRELLDSSFLKDKEIPGDDKTFFSLCLNEDEYTTPLPVGQSQKDKNQWEQAHIKCNLLLNIPKNEQNELNQRLNHSLERFKPGKNCGLYFTYFKPYENGLCYRLEIKEKLAKDTALLEEALLSIKAQIFFPEIHEPYPQYLADIIAKNISFGMDALSHALMANDILASSENFHLLKSYRS